MPSQSSEWHPRRPKTGVLVHRGIFLFRNPDILN